MMTRLACLSSGPETGPDLRSLSQVRSVALPNETPTWPHKANPVQNTASVDNLVPFTSEEKLL